MVYSNRNTPPSISAHDYLILDGIFRLDDKKRAEAIKNVRKYLPMPLDKATYIKLVSEGFDPQRRGWGYQSDAEAYLIRFRPRDLTTDIKTILGTSVNLERNNLLTNLLSGAQYPIYFDDALSIIDGFYDQTDRAQERNV